MWPIHPPTNGYHIIRSSTPIRNKRVGPEVLTTVENNRRNIAHMAFRVTVEKPLRISHMSLIEERKSVKILKNISHLVVELTSLTCPCTYESVLVRGRGVISLTSPPICSLLLRSASVSMYSKQWFDTYSDRELMQPPLQYILPQSCLATSRIVIGLQGFISLKY